MRFSIMSSMEVYLGANQVLFGMSGLPGLLKKKSYTTVCWSNVLNRTKIYLA